MSEKVIVALDAMGGDNAPVEIVKGAVEAVKEEAGLLVKLVGREEQVRAELAKYTYPQGQIEVVDAPDVIETGEQPVMAIRRKKDSSMVRALTMVKEKKADAFVSAGSSGAILVGGQVIVGRIRGVVSNFGICPIFANSSNRQRTWTGSLPPYSSSALSQSRLKSCV